MTCRIEIWCPFRDECEIVEVVQGNPCNPYIKKKDTPADYLPGDKPDPKDMRFYLTFDPVRVMKCRAGQIIKIEE
jgi:hypothetical protein